MNNGKRICQNCTLSSEELTCFNYPKDEEETEFASCKDINLTGDCHDFLPKTYDNGFLDEDCNWVSLEEAYD